MPTFSISTSSFCSKKPSNFSNFKLLSITSTKWECGLQSILGSFCQFVLTKINLSKNFDCK